MPRGLDASTTTAVGKTITKPYYLLYLGFSSISRLSSRGDITWSSQTWSDAVFDVSFSDAPTLSIFNENGTLGTTVLSDGTASRVVKIYYGDMADSAHPNPYIIFDGEMGEAVVGERVVIRCKRLKPLKTPRHFIAPPICNFIPSPDTRFDSAKSSSTLRTLIGR